LIKAGLAHRGFALIDVISPCVTFNDHEGSTKSYQFTRDHYHPAIHADFVPPSEEILADYEEGAAMPVILHDGSTIVLRKVDQAYDPTNRAQSLAMLQESQAAGEIMTGVLYIDESKPEMHEVCQTTDDPLLDLDYRRLCPGSGKLAALQDRFR